MGYFGPLGPAGFRRRGRRRGLAVGLMAGAAMARGAQANATRAMQQGTDAKSSLDAESALEKLAQLHDAGILTDEEFAAKKQQLLNK